MKIVKLIDLPIEWKKGNGLRKSDIEIGGENKCVLYGELFTKHKNVLIENNKLSKTNKVGSVKSQTGDILIPATSTASKKDMLLAREIEEDGVFLGGDINIIRPQRGVFAKKYLPYYFETEDAYEQLERYITGATGIIHISNTGLKNLTLPVPSLSEQKQIVSILDKSFSEIEKAKSIAEQNLKNTKEILESYLKNIKSTKQVLGELVDIKTGKLNSNASVKNGKYPFFTCSREVFAIDNYAFDLEAVLLAGNNASGDFNVKYYKGKFNAYQRTYIITVNKENKILYRYLYFQLLNSLKEFKEKSVGASTRFLKLSMIKEMKIPLPNIKEQEQIVKKLDFLSDEVKKLEDIYKSKIDSLEELKKSILQKAFSGELTSEYIKEDVKNTEEIKQ